MGADVSQSVADGKTMKPNLAVQPTRASCARAVG